jgi:hypothetical protein
MRAFPPSFWSDALVTAAETAALLPRVLVETPTPPALRKERIWKGNSRRDFPPVCLFSKQLLAFGS